MQAIINATTETASTLATIVSPLLKLGALVGLFVGPLWILARTLNVC